MIADKHAGPLAIILSFIVLVLWCPSANAQSSNDFLILDGIHKFSSADNPAWSLLSYDDSQWQSINVPGSWQSQRIKPIKGWDGIESIKGSGIKVTIQ